MKASVLTLTPAAVARVRHLLEKRGKPSAGIRLGIQTKGCSGLAYTIEYADIPKPGEEIIEYEDVVVMIDTKALFFVLGTEMDFVEDTMKSGFTFKNPNEKGRCGCGTSFQV
jgi:iron-sulfur cluster assembly protein